MSAPRFIPIVALVLSAGCAPVHFTRHDFSQPQFELDKQQCIYEVRMHTANNQPRVRGYYRSNADAVGAGLAAGIAHGLQQRELAIQCLRARGYSTQQ